MYATSVYWVIATFTSVGYGDVKGDTPLEYVFQLFVEMIGIAFYGYMLGMFQSMFSKEMHRDQLAQQQESLNHWIITLDKIHKNDKIPG